MTSFCKETIWIWWHLLPCLFQGPIIVKKSWESHIIKCINTIFQELFSEFNYLYYFLSYVLIKCYKRDESYCIMQCLYFGHVKPTTQIKSMLGGLSQLGWLLGGWGLAHIHNRKLNSSSPDLGRCFIIPCSHAECTIISHYIILICGRHGKHAIKFMQTWFQ